MVLRSAFLLTSLVVLASACASGKAVNNALGEPTHINTSTEPNGPAKGNTSSEPSKPAKKK